MSLSGLGEVFDFGSKLLDKFFPNPADAAQAKLELFKLQQSGELAQLAADTSVATKQADINIEEAKNPNLFVSGWRPAIGWTCGCAFFAKYVGGPMVFVIAQYAGHPFVLPTMDFSELMPILFGMLGLGAMRTFEKVKGVN